MNSKRRFDRSFGVRTTRPSVLAALLICLCQASLAQDQDLAALGLAPFPTTLGGGAVTLFQNVRIFDGKSAALSALSDVLVRANTIERISATPITADPNTNKRLITATR